LAKVLVVDDDATILASLCEWLEAVDKYIVEAIDNAEEARFRLKTYQYDAVVLDWELAGESGVEVCKEFRDNGGTTPVLMLTGKGSTDDKIIGLDAGCDDYLVKPFEPAELSARLRALLRRPAEKYTKVIKLGTLEVTPSARTASKSGKKLEFSARELDILIFLAKAPDTFFTASQIMDAVWSAESETSPDSVKVHVHRIRAGLSFDDAPPYLVSQRNLGYALKLERK